MIYVKTGTMDFKPGGFVSPDALPMPWMLIVFFLMVGAGLVKSKSMMLQTEGGYDTCARKRVEIAEHMR